MLDSYEAYNTCTLEIMYKLYGALTQFVSQSEGCIGDMHWIAWFGGAYKTMLGMTELCPGNQCVTTFVANLLSNTSTQMVMCKMCRSMDTSAFSPDVISMTDRAFSDIRAMGAVASALPSIVNAANDASITQQDVHNALRVIQRVVSDGVELAVQSGACDGFGGCINEATIVRLIANVNEDHINKLKAIVMTILPVMLHHMKQQRAKMDEAAASGLGEASVVHAALGDPVSMFMNMSGALSGAFSSYSPKY